MIEGGRGLIYPEVMEVVSIRLPRDMIDHLERIARAQRVTRSTTVRRMIEQAPLYQKAAK